MAAVSILQLSFIASDVFCTSSSWPENDAVIDMNEKKNKQKRPAIRATGQGEVFACF